MNRDRDRGDRDTVILTLVRRLRREAAAGLLAALLLSAFGSPGCGTRSDPTPGAPPPSAASRSRLSLREGAWETVEVSRIVDGDTLVLADGRTVRYLAVDAPEEGEPFHEAATALHRRLIDGHRLELLRPAEGPRRDAYGRALGIVAVQAGGEADVARTYAATELVRSGLAWVYQKTPDSLPPVFLRELLDAQREALQSERGIWSLIDRRSASSLRATRFRIHRPGCEHLREARSRAVRDVVAELAKGKSPCRSCRPLFAAE